MKCIAVLLLVFAFGLFIPNAFAENVPEWVKNTAGWWATDAISETEFLNAIEFLVNKGIIQVSDTTSGKDGSEYVPSWIKNTAGWWADGEIDDSSFVLGLQWLISNSIIIIEGDLIHTDADLRVAFIGDQGLGPSALAVLNLIKDEGAHMVLHQGDFDYIDQPDTWDIMISNVLGNDFPYFGTQGTHDIPEWDKYQQKFYDRLEKNPDVKCIGDLGIKSSCTYKGLFFILVSPSTPDLGHDLFIANQLENNDHIWRVCSWAWNMTPMQIADKGDRTGWGVYENCKNAGAIIATAHSHTYSRTKTLTDIENQVIDTQWAEPDKLRVGEGSTFVFVSAIGGESMQSQSRCLPTSYPYGCNGEWASIYTSSQDATSGALFCTFNAGGQPNKAYCYFKNINGRIIDEFTVSNFIGATPDSVSLTDIDMSGMDLTGNDFSNKFMVHTNLSNAILAGANMSDAVLIGTTLTGADLTDANLTGISLARKDLTGTILTGADLTDASLTGVDLSGKDLTGTILTGADLTDANLTGFDFSGKDLTGTKLRGVDLTDKDLTGTILTGADLTGANLDGVDISGKDLTGTKLRGVDLTDKDLTGTILRGADLTGASLTGVDISDMDLTDAILRGSFVAYLDSRNQLAYKDMTGTILTGADLTDASLTGVDLSGKDLTGTILTGTDLTDAILPDDIIMSKNNFINTIFDGVNLSGKDLSRSIFHYASFDDADLSNTDLNKAEFVKVDLTKLKSLEDADLTRATFSGSNFVGVDMSGVIVERTNFSGSNLSGVDFTVTTIRPGGSLFVQANLIGSNFEGLDLSPPSYFTTTVKNKAYLENADDQTIISEFLHEAAGFPNLKILSKEVSGNDLIVKYVFFNNFAGADLENANFKNANLFFINFYFADLTNADLSGADLRNALLAGANLSGANLSGANLSGANLSGVNMGNNSTLEDAILDEYTVLTCINHPICLS